MVNRNIEAEINNKIYWNKPAPVHFKSYGIDKLRNGNHHLDNIQIAELGEVTGKSLLHLQCHIGTDTLSWTRQDAVITGVDLSEKSIALANKLKNELNLDASFINCNVYGLLLHLDQTFDIVYTSQGVLIWLSDLYLWAKIIARYLKPNGVFYIMEAHPLFNIFDDSARIRYPYFHSTEPDKWLNETPDYADETYIRNAPTFEWQWAMSDIINALIKAGLKIDFLNEYDKIFYQGPSGHDSRQ